MSLKVFVCLMVFSSLSAPPSPAPFIALSVSSGWTGLRDELWIYPNNRVVELFESRLTRTRSIRLLKLPEDSLAGIKELVMGLELHSLPESYGEAKVYDAPIQRLTIRRGGNSRTVLISPGALLPEGLRRILNRTLMIRAIIRGMPPQEVIEVSELISLPDSALETGKAVAGVYERVGDEGWLVSGEARIALDPLPAGIEPGAQIVILGRFSQTPQGYRGSLEEVVELEADP